MDPAQALRAFFLLATGTVRIPFQLDDNAYVGRCD